MSSAPALDTIVALSSGAPPAGIAVIRMSGAAAHSIAEALAGPLPAPRQASLRHFHDPANGEWLDQGLLIRFDGPASATGEDLVEFHGHGGRAVVERMLSCLTTQPGCRLAEPGEFTRRALEAGRLNLIEVEGLSDLLEAETEAQRRAAALQFDGTLHREIDAMLDRVTALSAQAEALIDYDGEVEGAEDDMSQQIAACIATLDNWLSRPRAEAIRAGFSVVIAGPPNAGKSSLFNALVGIDRAIVTDVAGTTRDTIEALVRHDGLPLRLIDTAGIRESTDTVERIGIARTGEAMENADCVLWLSQDPPSDPTYLWLWPKSDQSQANAAAVPISASNVDQLRHLRTLLVERAQRRFEITDPVMSERAAAAVARARDRLVEAMAVDDLSIAAHLLLHAREALSSIAGRRGFDDMLDQLFGRFCLGK